MTDGTHRMPDKPTLDGIEERWVRRWEDDGTYRFDRTRPRGEVYAIDTPPPTVSGELHVGHVFSFTHTDIVARFQRMRGKAVFYPMGWDDNGLPTERRVQNVYGVRCEPSLPADPSFVPVRTDPDRPPRAHTPISRRDFVALCHELTREDERAFEELWRRLGLSVDWSLVYATIGAHAQRVSQLAFLRNLARGEAYRAEAPTVWDVQYGTAVAQAELEERERPGAWHRLAFRAGAAAGAGPGGQVAVDTTRPELLPACVALVVHPGDDRYRHLVGATVRTPLFGVEVPVLAHFRADPQRGTGAVMCCTFGDTTDVTWWRELDLTIRPVIGRDGRFLPDPPPGLTGDAYADLAGRTVDEARARIVGLLRESGDLLGEPEAIVHPVKFYENGDQPVEIVTSRQWYIRNGGRDADLRAALLERGRELDWHPPHMRLRYENWVAGLVGDWLISRQRFFGVPIPVWYPLDAHGEPVHDRPLLPDEHRLPVDPRADAPPGYTEEHRDRPGGFTADPDVMDTWATASLTPMITGGWPDRDAFARLFPMDLRPQAQEIIRTWLFSTVLRSHLELDALPWKHAAISGWILDPDRKKMSKSKGNALTPIGLLDEFGADAVRYWAASGRLGVDTAFEPNQMRIGRRLAVKLLNASRFVLGFAAPPDAGRPDAAGLAAPPGAGGPTEPVDRAMLAALADVVDDATAALDAYDHTRALARTEQFFWDFCDNYLELVKPRAYGADTDRAGSARAALATALSVLLRLFAPVLPYVTEEVWSWWRPGSVHTAPWPVAAELGDGDPEILRAASEVLRAVRRAKSAAKVSVGAAVAEVAVRGKAVDKLDAGRDDVRAATRAARLKLTPGDEAELVVSVVGLSPTVQ